MNVVDLFAGLGGWSEPFIDRGHYIVSVDWDARFDVVIQDDIANVSADDIGDAFEEMGRPPGIDIVLASPPCEGFTVMNIGKNWTRPTDDPPNAPKTERAWKALGLVQTTRNLIRDLEPRYFVIENPRGKLRRLSVVSDLERQTVSYCQYGLTSQKPTDLWGGFPPSLRFRPMCSRGAPCHVAAPRGSRTPGSIQGVTGADADALRAKIPYELAMDVCLAAENDVASPAQRPVRLHAWEPGEGTLFGAL